MIDTNFLSYAIEQKKIQLSVKSGADAAVLRREIGLLRDRLAKELRGEQ